MLAGTREETWGGLEISLICAGAGGIWLTELLSLALSARPMVLEAFVDDFLLFLLDENKLIVESRVLGP